MNKDLSKITHCRFYFNFEKEIEYINEMNRNGWRLLYIKGGIFYTYEKTEPDEYITILHAEEKENVSKMAAFAAQCGYENIPHTMDGAGTFMYLTGRKSEVSSDFVNESESRLKIYQHKLKLFTKFIGVYIMLDIMLATIAVFGLSLALSHGFNISNTLFVFVYVIMFALFTALTIYLVIQKAKYRKIIKQIKEKQIIYEI